MPQCPGCDRPVYFAERVTSIGKDWHRPCLRCANEACRKTLTAGSHSELNALRANISNVGGPNSKISMPFVLARRELSFDTSLASVDGQKRKIPQNALSAKISIVCGPTSKISMPFVLAHRELSFDTSLASGGGQERHFPTNALRGHNSVVGGPISNLTIFPTQAHREESFDHDGKPFCNRCYGALYGPKGYGHGGVESHVFLNGTTGSV
ncbi:LIM domain-containing protein [Ditylenchus destructor]|uniref:LIM domain-containing protein n=1 Tax=Ditylenchus destructor TaxID=166010 RepID=A0AAD4R846_9BILA|nr:LIM domain-containing protein [Ditylenchus destructor]